MPRSCPVRGQVVGFKYRFAQKEKRISLGTYPEVNLKTARERKNQARHLLANGVDPSENRKASKATSQQVLSNSFETVAREWLHKYAHLWTENYRGRTMRRLERDVFPWLGSLPIHEVTAPKLLEVIRRIENREALETAHRTLSNCGQILRYAIATGRAERDFSADLKGALPPVKPKHFPAITEPKAVVGLLRAIDGYKGTLIVHCALRLSPLVFVRPGELRAAQWADIDLKKAEWRYVATKTHTDHVVPLSRQAIAILQELQPATSHGRYVFPSTRDHQRPMSDNAILAALRRLGIDKHEMTGHGFRAMARTILDEVLGIRPDYIEHQLAHTVRDPNGRAYNRTTHLAERHKMMQLWADYLDELRLGD